MPKRTYTDEQKTEALRLYADVGPGEAARQLDIPGATIRKWAQRAGVTGDRPNQPVQAFEAAKIAWEKRRVTLADDIGQAVAEFVHHARRAAGSDGRSRDVQALMTAAAIGVDKAQLLAGGATSRAEFNLTEPEERRAAFQHVQDQLAARRAEQERQRAATEAGQATA